MVEAYRRTLGAKVRWTRAAKTGAARDALGTLEPGCEVLVLWAGQFSLIDALCAIVEQTGPADVSIATWTAAAADLTRAAGLLEQSAIRSMRWVVDRSFESRQPAFVRQMRQMFGDSSIRVTATHAKFFTVSNDRWRLACRTSANLNQQVRLETLEVSDDPGLCGFLVGLVDAIYAEAAEGDFAAPLTALESVANVPLPGGISAGTVGARLSYPSAKVIGR